MSEGARPDTWTVIEQALAKGGWAHHDFEGGDIDQRHVPEECRICQATAMLATLKADARRIVAAYDRTHAALEAALAREEKLVQAIEADAARAAYDAGMGATEWQAFVRPKTWAALAAVPVATRPCPKGDGCALNRGARTCRACGRNWPPDETWDAPAVPVATQEAARTETLVGVGEDGYTFTEQAMATPDDYARPGWRMFPIF